MKYQSIIAGDTLIRAEDVTLADFSKLQDEGIVTLITPYGEFCARDFHAIEAMWLLKPSSLEGKRFLWPKSAWAFHNLIGHPIMQILAWVGRGDLGVRFHDWTTPKPIGRR